MFTIYIFSSGAYMYSGDERDTFAVGNAIITQQPVPGYVAGQTRTGPDNGFPICQNGILCSQYTIGHSITFIPFIIFQKIFHPLPSNLFWYNSSPEMTFTALFYGPIVSALTVAVFYLVLREFQFRIKTSILVSFIFGLCTMVWPFSQTSFNIPPMILLSLCGFLYFVKFQKTKKRLPIFLAGVFYAASFQIREDAILFVLMVCLYLVIQCILKKNKVQNIFIFLVPVIISAAIFGLLDFIRFGSVFETGYGSLELLSGHSTPIGEGLFAILFSPGYGL
ncbi:MAG: hypothetical protein KGL95_06275, partial [Patescibacteria group bacterium]|nr:hypothetical protein [Patescibacteria group bacterium]